MELKRTNDDVIHVSLYTDHRDHDVGFSSLVDTTLTKSERERIAGNVIIQYNKSLKNCTKCKNSKDNKETLTLNISFSFQYSIFDYFRI